MDTKTKSRHRRSQQEQRACDGCRRKRRACDGVRIPPKPCGNCVKARIECTYGGSWQPQSSYIEALETRLELRERLMHQISTQAGPAIAALDSPESASPLRPKSDEVLPAGPGGGIAALKLRTMNKSSPNLSRLDREAVVAMADDHTHTPIGEHFNPNIGNTALVEVAVNLREKIEEKEVLFANRRARYWTLKLFENRIKAPHVGPFVFPSPDLLAELVDLYFRHKNIYYPVLHRSTFERLVADDLHFRDVSFGSLVLLVCGIGCRFSHHNLRDSMSHPGADPLKCGYQFFDQVPFTLQRLFVRPTLHHIQIYCLAAMFLELTNGAPCWPLVDIGLRIAQNVGVHRRPKRFARPTLESELWKRTFWVLVCMDRQCGAAHGVPGMMKFEEFDAELPNECDDEYWSAATGEPVHASPSEKPSYVVYFNSYIRLNAILGFTLSILYKSTRTERNLFSASEDQLVAELDSALNHWVEAIPSHLHWDPAPPQDDLFFRQSVMLHAAYNHVKITLHRPFVPMVRHYPSTTLPSLAMCTNAARSCAQVLDALHRREPCVPVPDVCVPAFTSGMILLLNVWDARRTGLPPHMNTALAEVHKCMEILKTCETRWQGAGYYWDILYELSSINEPPRKQGASANTVSNNSKSKKRTRGGESERTPTSTSSVHETASAPVYTPFQSSALQFNSITAEVVPQETSITPAPTTSNSAPHTDADPQGMISTSSWYPAQTSHAGFGLPDFVTNGTADAFPDDCDPTTIWEKVAAPMSLELEEWFAYFDSVCGPGHESRIEPFC